MLRLIIFVVLVVTARFIASKTGVEVPNLVFLIIAVAVILVSGILADAIAGKIESPATNETSLVERETPSNYSEYYKRLVCRECGGGGLVYKCSNVHEPWHKSQKLTDGGSEYHEDIYCSDCREAGEKYSIEEWDCYVCGGTGKDREDEY